VTAAILPAVPNDGAPLTLPEVRAQLKGRFDGDVSPATIQAYAKSWLAWTRWALAEGRRPALPVSPEDLVGWLRAMDRAELALATIRLRADALGSIHRQFEVDSPVGSRAARAALRRIAMSDRCRGKRQRQARPLRQVDLDAIRLTCRRPRRGAGGHPETAAVAVRRGALEAATCGLLHDGLLRISEACRARWGEFRRVADGSGRLFIPWSKTDRAGEGEVVWISPETTVDVLSLRRDSDGEGARILRVVRPETLTDRLRAACRGAGLSSGGWSGHSGRVGMAQDLAEDETPSHELQRAGRWSSQKMVHRYTREIAAGHGAAARWYKRRSGAKQP